MSAPPLGGVRSSRRSPRRLSAVSLLTFALLSGACKGGAQQTASPTGTTTPPSGPSPSVSTSSTGAAPLVASLPDGCDQGVPPASATITFAADGRAWAVAPDGSDLTCVFKVTDPGLFEWGPRGDRVVLGGLEVRGVGTKASRPAGTVEPSEASWSRPTGQAVVFIDPQGKSILKAKVGDTALEDVTPAEQEGRFPSHADIAFQEVVYHPSGGAFGFVMTDVDGSAVWMSTNAGATPTRLIWSNEGTTFGPIAFAPDGGTLFYAAHLANGTRMISKEQIGHSRVTTGLWLGKQDVLRMLASPDGTAIALDIGTGCDDRQALVSHLDSTDGEPLLPAAAGPTSVIGWIDGSTVLVSEGGCNGPTKLWIAPVASGGGVTLVTEAVDRAAVRVPDATPPPAIPTFTLDLGAA
jgi:hypothetical protein